MSLFAVLRMIPEACRRLKARRWVHKVALTLSFLTTTKPAKQLQRPSPQHPRGSSARRCRLRGTHSGRSHALQRNKPSMSLCGTVAQCRNRHAVRDTRQPKRTLALIRRAGCTLVQSSRPPPHSRHYTERPVAHTGDGEWSHFVFPLTSRRRSGA